MHRSKTGVFRQVEHDLISLEMTLPGYPAWVTSSSVSFQHIWFEHKLPKGSLFLFFLSYFTNSLTGEAAWVYVRAELCIPLGGTVFLLGLFFSFQLFNWAALSIWYRVYSLLCQLRIVIAFCISFIRCFNSVYILHASIWLSKTRNQSPWVFWYEEGGIIFIVLPRVQFHKGWYPLNETFAKCVSLLHEHKRNKICAERFKGIPNFTKISIHTTYIWTMQS